MATIYGTNGNDRNDLGGGDLVGTSQADSIYGLAGNDLLDGLGGNDYLDGGTGTNTIRGGAGFDYVKSAGTTGWYDGGADADIMDFTGVATAGRFDLAAGSGKFGSAAAFTMRNFESLCSGAGADWIWGTDGVNEIRSGAGHDNVYALGGNDTIRAGTGDDLAMGGAGNDWIEGEDGRDTLYGDQGNDQIYAGAGNDTVYGGTGNDFIVGGWGSDKIDGGDGFDTVSLTGLADLYTTPAIDLATGTITYSKYGYGTDVDTLAGVEKVVGSVIGDRMIAAATTEFHGMGGHDNILSGSGANILNGGADNDWINYERSTAAVSVNLATQTATGGWASGDVLTSFENAKGSAHADTIRGSSGANMLSGEAGNDLIYGEAGDDRIWGDAGWDQMWGGAGADRFIFAHASDSPNSAGPDWIRDFSAAQGDKIVLLFDANLQQAGKQGFTSLQAGADGWDASFTAGTIAYRHSGGDTYIDLNLVDQNNANGFDAAEVQIRLAGTHDLGWNSFDL